MFSDMESMVQRPLDNVRNLEWYWKLPVNIVFISIIILLGSDIKDGR